MEMPGIEPGAFHMQSERSTAELHPPWCLLHQITQVPDKSPFCAVEFCNELNIRPPDFLVSLTKVQMLWQRKFLLVDAVDHILHQNIGIYRVTSYRLAHCQRGYEPRVLKGDSLACLNADW